MELKYGTDSKIIIAEGVVDIWIYQKLVMSKWKLLRFMTSMKQDATGTQYMVLGITVARTYNK